MCFESLRPQRVVVTVVVISVACEIMPRGASRAEEMKNRLRLLRSHCSCHCDEQNPLDQLRGIIICSSV